VDNKLSQSVGARGSNKLSDVIKVQVMLRLIHRGSGGTGPYYKGKVDGIVGGQTTAAIQLFTKHYLEELNSKTDQKSNYLEPIFKPKSAMTKALRSYSAGKIFLSKVKMIVSIPVLYKFSGATNGNKELLSRDRLVPSSLARPIEQVLDALPFSYSYLDVRLGLDDKFKINVGFPAVKFIDQSSVFLKETANINSTFLKMLKKALVSTSWNFKVESTGSSNFSLITKKPTGLRKAIEKLDQHGGVGRVFSDIQSFDLIIPDKREVLRFAGRIHADVCATIGVLGGKVLVDRKTAQYAAEILKKHPGDLDKRIPRHCKSCDEVFELIKLLDAEELQLFEEMQSKIEEYASFYKRSGMIEYETSMEALNGKVFNALVGLFPVPIDGEALLKGELTYSQSYVVDKLGDLAIANGKRQLKGGRTKAVKTDIKNGKFLKRAAFALTLIDILDAVVSSVVVDFKQHVTGSMITSDQYFNLLEEFKRRTDTLAIDTNNYNALIDKIDIDREKHVKDAIIRKCGTVFSDTSR